MTHSDPHLVGLESSIPDHVGQARSRLSSGGLPKLASIQKNYPFTAADCAALAGHLLDSIHGTTNRLSCAFEGSAGFQAVFRLDGLYEFCLSLPALIPFFEIAAQQASNAFFVNVLVVRDAVNVKSHLDCSLDPFLPSHKSPERVSVLYIQVPDDLTGGALQLYRHDGSVSEITPTVGLMVQFCGETIHAVSEVKTNSERISVILEEYQLDERQLASVPRFSLSPDQALLATRRGYETVCEFVDSLTADEQAELKILAADQSLWSKLNSNEQ